MSSIKYNWLFDLYWLWATCKTTQRPIRRARRLIKIIKKQKLNINLLLQYRYEFHIFKMNLYNNLKSFKILLFYWKIHKIKRRKKYYFYEYTTCKITRSLCCLWSSCRCITSYSSLVYTFSVRLAGGGKLSIIYEIVTNFHFL